MSATPELRHLRAFVTVAEELSFSRAARRLHIAQQALSSQIRQMEKGLEVQLFQRTTRKVELTQAGRTLLAHALPILKSFDIACEQTRRAYSGEIGQLSIAYTPTVAAEALPKLMLEMHRQHPDVSMRACEMWQAESVAAVDEGRFDIGFARCPKIRGDLECVSIREEPLGIVLGSAHPLASTDIVRVADLADETLTIWPRSLSPGFYDRVVEALRAHRFDGPIHEFENLGSGVLFSDTAARVKVAECRAFSVAFPRQYESLPPGYVWRALEPAPTVPLHMFWKRAGGATVSKLVAVARHVSRRELWMAPEPRGDDGSLVAAPGTGTKGALRALPDA
ncbi:MAG: LysR family transcriptional regulator [Pseudonocardiaceae bacterium]|nr:LysR family transcriptional regulator [Pseudonocardiaceae bacterium]